jgi:hypothetical protein
VVYSGLTQGLLSLQLKPKKKNRFALSTSYHSMTLYWFHAPSLLFFFFFSWVFEIMIVVAFQSVFYLEIY